MFFTSSSSRGLVCSILLKLVSPAFTMAVDKVWPEIRCSIITCSYSAWCSTCIYTTVLSTYLFQLFGNKGGVFPKLGSEALSQDQRVKQSRKNSLGWETEELCQAWLRLTDSERLEQHEILSESTFFMCTYVFETYICWCAFHFWRSLLRPG